MPELLPPRVLAELRRMALGIACALPLCGLAGGAWAQGVPAGLRACAAESDPGRRLACYDRVMKRISPPPATAAGPSAGPATATAATSAAAPASAAAPTPSQSAGNAGQEPPDSAAPRPASADAAKPAPPAPHHSSPWKIFSSGAPFRLTAHVASLHRSPDSMVLRLDDGQVWRQIGRASGDLTLQAGDEVTIEKHLGSYWLSSRYVSDMKVRRESR